MNETNHIYRYMRSVLHADMVVATACVLVHT